MASDSFVQVDTDGSGKRVDTEDLTVGGQEVQRQRIINVPGSLPQGCLIKHVVSASGINATLVKNGPGQVYGWDVFSPSTPLYLKFHNSASSPTAGAGVVKTVAVQAGVRTADTIPPGLAFDTGIGFTVVTGIADSDTTGVSANDCVIDIYYK